jgi:thiol-disulfide isomerase/thioredoxin
MTMTRRGRAPGWRIHISGVATLATMALVMMVGAVGDTMAREGDSRDARRANERERMGLHLFRSQKHQRVSVERLSDKEEKSPSSQQFSVRGSVEVTGERVPDYQMVMQKEVPPMVFSASPLFGTVGGYTVVTIKGKHFGMSDKLPVATIGGVNCVSTQWVSDTEIRCTTPPVDRAAKSMSGIIGVTVLDMPEDPLDSNPKRIAFTYKKPQVTGFSPRHGPAYGGTEITIKGNYFGTAKAGAIAALHGQPCAYTKVVDPHTIKCKTPRGDPKPTAAMLLAGATDVDGTSNVAVLIGRKMSVAPNKFTYDPTEILKVGPKEGAAHGGEVVVLSGRNLGTAEGKYRPAVKIAGVECAKTQYVSATQLRCTTRPAPNGVVNTPVAVTVRIDSSTSLPTKDATYTYLPPRIHYVAPNTGPAYGGTKLAVHGAYFGGKDTVVRHVRIDGVACPHVEWVSDKLLHCTTPAARGLQREGSRVNVVVTVEQVDSANDGGVEGFTYDPIAIEDINPPTAAAYGGTFITLAGRNLGEVDSRDFNPRVLIGERQCKHVTVLEDGKKLKCMVPATTLPANSGGNGIGAMVTVKAGPATSAPKPFRIEPPTIVKVTPGKAPTFAHRDGTRITISGRFLGDHNHLPRITVNDEACTKVQIEGTDMGTAVSCALPVGDRIGKPTIKISVTSDKGTVMGETKELFEFLGPEVISLSPQPVPSYGGVQLTVEGERFGTSGSTVQATVNGKQCEKVTRVSDKKLICVTPVTKPGMGVAVNVIADGIVSLTPSKDQQLQMSSTGGREEKSTLTLSATTVQAVEPPSGPTYGGGMSILINGQNLGEEGMKVEATIGGNPCLETKLVTSAQVRCVLPPGKPGSTKVTVSVGKATTARFTGSFTYLPPEVKAVSPSQVPTYGGVRLSITGNNLGDTKAADGLVTKVTIGGKKCGNVKVVTSEEITCVAPKGLRPGSNPIVVSVGKDTSSSPFQQFSVMPPAVSSVQPQEWSSTGYGTIDIKGQNLGVQGQGHTITALINGVKCVTTELISDTHVKCVVPPGRGDKLEVTVQVNTASSEGANSNPAASFSYLEPEIESVEPSEAAWYGGASIQIKGKNLGLMKDGKTKVNGKTVGNLPTVTISGVPCTGARFSGSPEFGTITCTASPGPLGEAAVVAHLEKGGATGSSAKGMFAYKPPLASTVQPEHLPAYGGIPLSITGFFFGDDDECVPSVTVGGKPCKDLKYFSDKKVTCTLPKGNVGPANTVVNVKCKGKDKVSSLPNSMAKYSPPIVERVDPAKIPTYGNKKITIYGRFFGLNQDAKIKAFVDEIECKDAKRINDGEVTCTAPAGGGDGNKIVVSVDGVMSLPSSALSYADVLVRQVNPSSGPAFGGTKIKIVGENFGDKNMVFTVDIGGTPCAQPKRISPEVIMCTAPPGDEGESKVTVSLHPMGGRNITGSEKFTYKAPEVGKVYPSSGPSYGGTKINIYGHYLGDSKHVPSILVGGKICTGAKIEGKEGKLVSCLTPPGIGDKKSVVVNLKTVATTVRGKFSFKAPALHTISPQRGPSYGGTRIEIRGDDLGISTAEQEILITVGGLKCHDVSVDVAHHVVSCTTPKGVSKDAAVVVSVDEVPSNELAFEFVKPTVKSVSPSTIPTYGGQVITIEGDSLGTGEDLPLLPVVRVSGGMCTNVKVLELHKKISCTSPAGKVGPAGVVVSVRKVAGSTFDKSVYEGPEIISAHPDNSPTYGGQWVTFKGKHLGNPQKYRNGNAEILVDGRGCDDYKYEDPTTVQCLIPRAVGSVVSPRALVKVRMDGNETLGSEEAFRYKAPTVMTVVPTHGPATGGFIVRITGFNFGVVDGSKEQQPEVAIGGHMCVDVTLISHSELTCRAPRGAGRKQNVVVAVGRHTSPENIVNGLFEYDDPKVISISPERGPSYGGQEITISGNYFGTFVTDNVTVTIGKIPAEECRRINMTTVTCLTGHSKFTGHPKLVRVFVAGRGSSDHVFYDYEGPKILSVSVNGKVSEEGEEKKPHQIGVFGGDIINITGIMLGEPTNKVIASIGGIQCARTERISEERVVCETAPGTGKAQPIQVHVFQRPDGSGKEAIGQGAHAVVSYMSPYVYCIDPASSAPQGGTKMSIWGRNFGSNPAQTITAHIGGIACENTTRMTDHLITCVTPAGTGSDLDVTVEVSGPSGSHSSTEFTKESNKLFSYEPVKIVSLHENIGPAAGKSIFMIKGHNFGGGILTASAFVGERPCLKTEFVHQGVLMCTAPIGGVGQQPVVVKVGSFTSGDHPEFNFTYTPPVVSRVEPQEVLAIGGSVLNIYGKDLGAEWLSPIAYVGDTRCRKTMFISSTHLQCEVGKAKTIATKKVPISVAVGESKNVMNEETPAVKQMLPEIHEIKPDTGPWFGGTEITVKGQYFATGRDLGDGIAEKPVVTVGGLSCRNLRLVATNIVKCTTPPGFGSSRRVKITVAGLESEVLKTDKDATTFAYEHPSVDSFDPKEGPIYGGAYIVTLKGSLLSAPQNIREAARTNYADLDLSPRVTIGGIECLATTTVSESEVKCALSPGVVGDNSTHAGEVRINMLGNYASAEEAFSYRRPQITKVTPPYAAMYGGGKLNITGRFLGSSALTTIVKIDGTPCVSTLFIDENSIVCEVPAGTGKQLPIEVVVKGTQNTIKTFARSDSIQDGELAQMRYEGPIITDVTPKDGPEYGHQWITVKGRHFGPKESAPEPNATEARSAKPVPPAITVAGVPCIETEHVSEEELRCLTPASPQPSQEWGAGSSQLRSHVLANIFGVTSKAEPATASAFTFNAIEVTRVVPSVGPTYGNTNVLIYGKNFGAPTGDIVPVAHVGGEPCLNTSLLNPGTLRCILPPSKMPRVTTVSVHVQNRRSENADNKNNRFVYEPPVITSIEPSEGAFYGGTEILIVGRHFGSEKRHTQVTVGGEPCHNIVHVGDSKTAIKCIVPEQEVKVGTRATVVVSVGEEASVGGPTLLVSGPKISVIKPPLGSTYGGEKIAIQGSFFGKVGQMTNESIQVMIGDFICEEATLITESLVTCITPEASSYGARDVVVKVFEKPSNLGVFTYSPLVVSKVEPASGATNGDYTIDVHGACFKGKEGMTSVRIGGVPCTDVELVNPSHLRCKVPEGSGANQNVAVSVVAQESPNGQAETTPPNSAFSYKSPQIISAEPLSGPKRGETMITVKGKNFGPEDSKALVFVGKSPCVAMEWVSHEELRCGVPPGRGSNEISAVVDGLSPNDNTSIAVNGSTPMFVYDAAVVENLGSMFARADGTSLVVLLGYNFGGPNAEDDAMQQRQRDEIQEMESVTIVKKNMEADREREDKMEHAASISSEKREAEAEEAKANTAATEHAQEELAKLAHERDLAKAQEDEEQSEEDHEREIAEKKQEDAVKQGQSDRDRSAIAAEEVIAGQNEQADMERKAAADGSEEEKEEEKEAEEAERALRSAKEKTQIDDAEAELQTLKEMDSAAASARKNITELGKEVDIEEQAEEAKEDQSRNGTVHQQDASEEARFKERIHSISSLKPQHATHTRYSVANLPPVDLEEMIMEKAFNALKFIELSSKKSHGHMLSRNKGQRIRRRSLAMQHQLHRFKAINRSDHTAQVMIGGKPCRDLKIVSDTRMECIAPAGVGSHLTLEVHLAGDEGRSATIAPRVLHALSYEPPTVSRVDPATATGGQVIKIIGMNFGPNETATKVLIGGLQSLQVRHLSDTVVEAVVPEGVGAALGVTVVVGDEGNGTRSSMEQDANMFSYNQPEIHNISVRKALGRGGQITTITGRYFGNATVSKTAKIYVGMRPCMQTHVISSEKATCVIPAGVGSQVPVTITVADQSSDVHANTWISYEAPVITGMTPTSIRTIGGTTVRIMGKNFGAATKRGGPFAYFAPLPGHHQDYANRTFDEVPQVSITIDHSACRQPRVLSDSVVECFAPPGEGSGKNVPVILTAGAYDHAQVSQPYLNFSYGRPVINAVVPATGNAGDKIVVYGDNFGDNEDGFCCVSVGPRKLENCQLKIPPVRRSNRSAGRNETMELSPMQLHCTVPGGLGLNLPVRAKVRGLRSEITKFSRFSYAAPRVAAVVPSRAAAHTMVTIRGSGFGPNPKVVCQGFDPSECNYTKITVTIDNKLCEHMEYISDTELKVTVPEGEGVFLKVIVTAGGQSSFNNNYGLDYLSGLFSYDGPSITSVSPSHGPTSGRTNLTVSGFGFGDGMNATVYIGKNRCADWFVINEHKLICTTPPGIGGSHIMAAVIAGQRTSVSPTHPPFFSYDLPIIQRVSPSRATPGNPLKVYGENFGTKAINDSVQVFIGGLACNGTIRHVSDSEVICPRVPRGVGAKRSVVVVVDGQSSEHAAIFSYSNPVVTAAEPAFFGPGVSGGDVIILGNNFGMQGQAHASIGGIACSETKVLSTSRIKCSLEPNNDMAVGTGQNVKVTVAGQSSAPNTLFDFAAPTVESIEPQHGPAEGGYKLTIRGSGFFGGNGTNGPSVSVGDCKCLFTTILSANSAECIVPARKGNAKGDPRPVIVNVAGQVSKSSSISMFTYDAPVVQKVRPVHAEAEGGTVLRISGINFGVNHTAPESPELQAFVGGKACQSTKWVNNEIVECVAPAGEGQCKDVRVEFSGLSSTMNGLFSYDLKAGDTPIVDVKKLNEVNVDQIVRGGPTPMLVLFWSPACESAKNFVPHFEEVAKLMRCRKVNFASVRVDLHPTLASRFGVRDTPAVAYFPAGRIMPTNSYRGRLSGELLIRWLARVMQVHVDEGSPLAHSLVVPFTDVAYTDTLVQRCPIE